MTSKIYDFIIIGGGTGGLVLANSLSAVLNLQVLIMKARADQKNEPPANTHAL